MTLENIVAWLKALDPELSDCIAAGSIDGSKEKFVGVYLSLIHIYGKTGVFDAFDETISQWIDAVRAGRVQKYIPETMIPRNPINGDLGAVNSFGTNFVAVEGDDGSQSNDKIETIQPEIRYEAYLSTYTATVSYTHLFRDQQRPGVPTGQDGKPALLAGGRGGAGAGKKRF